MVRYDLRYDHELRSTGRCRCSPCAVSCVRLRSQTHSALRLSLRSASAQHSHSLAQHAMDDSDSPVAPLSPMSISLPPLAKERQRAAARMSLGAVSSVASLGSIAAATAASSHSRNASSASSSQYSTARTAHTRDSSSASEYTGAFSYSSTLAGIPPEILSEQKTAGHWVAFNGGMESSPLLPGPNGGGGVGLPNFVPLGHPSLSLAAMGGENARQRHGNKTLLAAGLLEGSGSKLGLEGAPFVSAADRNRAESRQVSEATMLLASLARDAAAHGTPRTIEKHNTTLAQLRVSAAGGGSRAFQPSSTFNPHGPSGGPSSNPLHVPRAMPAFEVDKFLRANQRMMSNQDRMSAADVLRIESDKSSSARSTNLSASSGMTFRLLRFASLFVSLLFPPPP